jgi:hypothetical protein
MMRLLQRLTVGFFCWLTALYAFLCSSAFAYQQFIRPRVFPVIGVFAAWHGRLALLCLAVALVSIARELRQPGPQRVGAWSFAVVATACTAWIAVHPLLPTLVDDRRSLIVGIAALVPILWLCVIDHLASAAVRRYDASAPPPTAAIDRIESRLLTASVATALIVPLLYAVLTPIVLAGSFEPDLLSAGLTLGLGWNAVDHLVVFGVAFVAAALVNRLTARAHRLVRYGAALALLAGGAVWVAATLFISGIGLDGAGGAAAATAVGLSIVAAWSGIRVRSVAESEASSGSGFDLVFGVRPASGRWTDVARIVAIGAAAYGLGVVAQRVDWDFMVAKLGVVAIWMAVFVFVYRAAPDGRRVNGLGLAAACLFPLALHSADVPLGRRIEATLGDGGTNLRHTLDRYVVYNPSFRLVDSLLRESSEEPSFDRFLRANTGLAASRSQPVDVDFVRPLEPARERPWIFLFVIDSLRPDYLGAYNAAATFTPRIDTFGREGIVFQRAFTRYGGTGLSMPSIWMGAAGVHTQYVTPFRPMNALEKLLDANQYRRYITLDHIMAQLLTPSPQLEELDRGVQEMSLDFCQTLGELEDRVGRDAAPSFAHTRSLNLHVAAIRASSAADADAYPGFEARYASRVRRMDGCFGRFIDFLKRRDIYDRSLIVLTADHGEELGADGRWGHAYYLFPGILQVPLLVHLPRSLAGATVDPDAIAFTTDITPTLYAALGYRPAHGSPLMGQPLIRTDDTDDAPRRRSAEVVIASYGAVYGALTADGHRLYIADGNHATEYAYERSPAWRQVPVTDGLRAIGQRAIREYIEEIALEYGVAAER